MVWGGMKGSPLPCFKGIIAGFGNNARLWKGGATIPMKNRGEKNGSIIRLLCSTKSLRR